MGRQLDGLFRYINQLDQEHWLLLFAAAVIVGYFFLRGHAR